MPPKKENTPKKDDREAKASPPKPPRRTIPTDDTRALTEYIAQLPGSESSAVGRINQLPVYFFLFPFPHKFTLLTFLPIVSAKCTCAQTARSSCRPPLAIANHIFLLQPDKSEALSTLATRPVRVVRTIMVITWSALPSTMSSMEPVAIADSRHSIDNALSMSLHHVSFPFFTLPTACCNTIC